MAEPKVKITETKVVKAYWGAYTVIYRSDKPGEIEFKVDSTHLPDLETIARQIAHAPEGFVQFALAIQQILQEHKPPEPKKPRKVRSDKGSKKIKTIPPEVI